MPTLPSLFLQARQEFTRSELGALLRVCEGAGVGRVLLRDRGSAPLTPTVAKTSAGATEWLAVERIVNAAAELERRKAQGFWIYGADAAGDPPWSVDLTGKVVLCLGGEEKASARSPARSATASSASPCAAGWDR